MSDQEPHEHEGRCCESCYQDELAGYPLESTRDDGSRYCCCRAIA